MSKVYIPQPLPHQEPIDRSPARYKVGRCGRRWGKTRFGFKAGVVGHGPEGSWTRSVRGTVVERWDGPKFRGVAHGKDVAWIVRDMPQSDALWTEEIVPRFEDVPGIHINAQKRWVQFPGGGKLWIRSAENINSVRGAGAKLIGIIVDEAAWQDLRHHLYAVLRPMMLDNGAWLVLLSTTNSGRDGNREGRVPSFFNTLCEEIAAGQRGENWAEFHGTAFDNPKLDPADIDELISEYPADSVELAQEVFAKVLRGGSGLAFPEWDEAVHVQRYEPPADAVWTGGGDWGSSAAGALYLNATWHRRSMLRHEFKFNGPGVKKPIGPRRAGYLFGMMIRDRRLPLPQWMAVDTPPMPFKAGAPTILERLQQGYRRALGKRADETAWVNPPKGTGSRLTKKQLLHDLLAFERKEDGTVPEHGMPDLHVHPDCVYFISTIGKLTKDEKRPEDVNTAQEDHAYDAVTAWAMARVPEVERPRGKRQKPDHAPADWLELTGGEEQPMRERRFGGSGGRRFSRRGMEVG